MATPTSMFGNAVARILDSWTALQLAVENGFGGAESREKAEWMVFAIETWFKENESLHPDEVEDFLEDVLNAEFDLRVEDNSAQEISRLICLHFRLCQENKVDELNQRLQALPKARTSDCRKADTDMEEEAEISSATPSASGHTIASSTSAASSSSTEMGDQMDTSEQQEAKPEEDDGWQVIQRGKKKK